MPETRNDKILRMLRRGEESASNLALICDCPKPSIRRSVQELRVEGHNICFADEREQIYRLREP